MKVPKNISMLNLTALLNLLSNDNAIHLPVLYNNKIILDDFTIEIDVSDKFHKRIMFNVQSIGEEDTINTLTFDCFQCINLNDIAVTASYTVLDSDPILIDINTFDLSNIYHTINLICSKLHDEIIKKNEVPEKFVENMNNAFHKFAQKENIL